MTEEEKLISLLQPKGYTSKIKLYCNSYPAAIKVKEKLIEFEIKEEN